MSSFSLRDNLTIENGKSLKWLDATGTNRKDILTLDGFNVVKMNSAGSDIYINNSVNSTTWVNIGNSNNVIIGSKLGIGTSTVSGTLSLPSNSIISTDSTNGTLTLTAGRDATVNSSKIIFSANGTGGNLDLYTGSTTGSGIRFYSGSSSLKRFHIYDNGLFNFTPDGSTISVSLDNSSLTTAIPVRIQNTVDSTSTSIGALILSGGAGIVRNLNVGGTMGSSTISTGNLWASNVNIASGNATMNTLSITGSLSIPSTVDASGIGTGGSLTILGGAAISKRLFANTLSIGTITNEFTGSFSGNNNVTSATDIVGLAFSTTDTRSFTVTMSISILASASLYSQTIIEGIWKNGSWEIFTSSLGDATGITFSITSAGQLRYTSLNYTSWVSTTFRWTAKVINQTGTHNPPSLPTTGAQTITGPLTITSSTNAVSGSTGALTVAGGVGIAGDLVVGGNIFSNVFKTQIATSSFSVTPSHKNFIFLVSGDITINLLSAVSAGVNYTVSFSKGDSINTSVQIFPQTNERIEGLYTNYLLTNFNDLVTFISDGTGWRILQSRNQFIANIYSLPGTYYFTVPNPVTTVYVCVFGAGGGGASGSLGSSSGNGGGGGGYSEGIITVTPGETLTVNVGAGGGADSPGESSSVSDIIAYGGGAGSTNSIGNWGSVGSAGNGEGGTLNRSGGVGGTSPSQISGGGGGGGAAGKSGAGVSGSSYIGGNGSFGFGGSGATTVDTMGTNIRITNFYREGGGGASGNIDTVAAIGMNGGFPGGGGSGSSDGSGGIGGDGCVIIYF